MRSGGGKARKGTSNAVIGRGKPSKSGGGWRGESPMGEKGRVFKKEVGFLDKKPQGRRNERRNVERRR